MQASIRTSIRLGLMSLLVCAITFAASGAPLPFQPKTADPGHGVDLAASSIPH